MIESEIIKINNIKRFDNNYIEKELSVKYNNIVRWAITDIDKNHITISLSYIL